MFERKFESIISTVVVIGCGGTGSRAIPLMVQILKNSPRALAPRLVLIDDDVVEHKNLARQNFINQDVGRSKAEVLAERYSVAMDFPIVSNKARISGNNLVNVVDQAMHGRGWPSIRGTHSPIFILCVDTMEARMDILKQLPGGSIVIEAGNEDTFGNVTVFDVSELRGANEATPFYGTVEIPVIPAPVARYEHALKNPSVKTGSCADLDQSAAINNLMAAGINTILQNISYGIPLRYRTKFYDLAGSDHTEIMNVHWYNQEYKCAGIKTAMPMAHTARADALNRDLAAARKIPKELLAAIA